MGQISTRTISHEQFGGLIPTCARKAANTFLALGDYAQLGGDLTGHSALQNVGKSLHNLGQSIHNVRRGALANRIRSDFGEGGSGGSIMN